MRKLGSWRWAAVVLAAVGGVVLAQTQQIHQQGFEGRETLWLPAGKDADYQELDHRLTDARLTQQADERVHSGQRAEFIHISARAGSFIHYSYPLGKAPVTEDLSISLWVCGNRPGVQLSCRVILPRERDPQSAGEPLTVLLPGETYQLVNRWQALSIRQPVKALRDQLALLRASLKHDVSADGAYVDRLVLNVYTGPGDTKVWVDDLEAGPVVEEAAPAPRAGGQPVAIDRRASEVRLLGGQLMVSGQRFFMRGIRHTGTPLKVLHDAYFNTVMLDETTPQGLLEDAVNLGFWVVPTLASPYGPLRPGGPVEGQLTARETEFGRKVSRFLDTGAVLAWDLGGNLTLDHSPLVSRTAQLYRNADPMRPVAADISDGYRSYAGGMDVDALMVGAHRWPLLTGLELDDYREWLAQRRRLVPRKTFCWTWIQTHLPDWFTTLAYDHGSATRFDEPVGPQPEQIRLLAYAAVGCGYKGLGFWSDRFLADSHTGRDRLLGLALLNLELQMLEPLLVDVKEQPAEWIGTNRGDVKAAVLRSDRGVLVLPIWMGDGGQFVPGHGATPGLQITVPQVPADCQAWEVTPGRLQSYPCKRVLGGTQVTLHDFSLTSALVFTSDLGPTGLVVRFQEQQRRMRRLAAQWAHDLAEEELAKALKVQAELERLGRKLPDGEGLAQKARESLDRCKLYRRNGDSPAAYEAAQVSLQATRLLMRAHWDQAVRGLDAPVASPYATSFFTLPRHYQFVEEVRQLRAGDNVLRGGDFEAPADQTQPNWLIEDVPSLDAVDITARRVRDFPHGGGQCLMLKVAPKPSQTAPPVLERTFVAIYSPAVHLEPGTIVKISAWIRVPGPITGSVDGALLYDSAGGEPLALRITKPQLTWKQVTLYRRVPPSGAINVVMAMTGVGTVYFDDVRIEPLTAGAAPGSPDVRGTLVNRPVGQRP
jgi:hypothetical protein